LHFSFKMSNNQDEYEPIIVGLVLAQDVKANRVIYQTDSRLIVGHLIGEYQVKDTILFQYYHLVQNMIHNFVKVKLEHISKGDNIRIDVLFKLAR